MHGIPGFKGIVFNIMVISHCFCGSNISLALSSSLLGNNAAFAESVVGLQFL